MKTNSSSKRYALILVDLQNDFVDGGALAVRDGNAVIPVANRLMEYFNLVVATQDWHPANHQSFASQHAGISVGQTFMLHGLLQTAWPDHCVQNTFGAELVAELNCQRINSIIRKGTDPTVDSYSGFFDNGHRRATGLDALLRENNVGTVVVMGLATDYCVRFTTLDAIQLGYEAVLVSDGCRGVELQSGDVEKAIEELRNAGTHIVDLQYVCDKMASGEGIL